MLPLDFELPKGSPLVAWQYWMCGSRTKHYPPLRKCKPSDISNRTTRKRFSEYKILMNMLEVEARRHPPWVETPTIDQANRQFGLIKHIVSISEITEKNRSRRVGQISWTTVVRLLREENRFNVRNN
jgi:hypothetical protein